jgi:hypothetical protein
MERENDIRIEYSFPLTTLFIPLSPAAHSVYKRTFVRLHFFVVFTIHDPGLRDYSMALRIGIYMRKLLLGRTLIP